MDSVTKFIEQIPPPQEIRQRLSASIDETAALRKLLRISEKVNRQRPVRVQEASASAS